MGVVGVGGTGAQDADELIVVHAVQRHLLFVLSTPICTTQFARMYLLFCVENKKKCVEKNKSMSALPRKHTQEEMKRKRRDLG
jgi:hypothetical protein